MAYKYGKRSIGRLSTCHPKLQEIFQEAIEHMDITILEGHRTVEKQQEYFKKGMSRCDGIEKLSNHQYSPARAIDAAPYPVNWNDIEGFKEYGALIKKIAEEKGIKIVWGGDFKGFFDGPHVELHKCEK